MDEDDCAFLLLPLREFSALRLNILTATSKAEVKDILQAYDVSEGDFNEGFPNLMKVVQDLPDERPSTP